jgi:crotonobetainyl-CoA:carnitine CoA-transferase CaiB-like acyl-CoA transferase
MSGIRILDLSIALTGPYAAALLGDQGADVIKVERPGIGDIARWIGVSSWSIQPRSVLDASESLAFGEPAEA